MIIILIKKKLPCNTIKLSVKTKQTIIIITKQQGYIVKIFYMKKLFLSAFMLMGLAFGTQAQEISKNALSISESKTI